MTIAGAIIDADPRSRAAFERSLERYAGEAGLPGLERAEVGQCTCLWRASPSAPVARAEEGTLAVWTLGTADGAREGNHAEALLSHLKRRGTDGIARYSGYFVAVASAGEDCYVFTDRLGLFPCYYAERGRVLVLGTSSHIATMHAAMSRTPNWRGIVGHLLCMHEVLGESVWEGARRLGVGEVLHVGRAGARVLPQRAIPVGDGGFGLPYETQLERAHAAMAEALAPYRGRPFSALVSGGLDSRLVAGYLSSAGTAPEAAYTLGDPTDTEYRCARRLCAELGWPQRRVPVELSRFTAYADRQVEAEQLSNGFNDLSWWSLVEAAGVSRAPVVTGVVGDAVLGGSHLSAGYDAAAREYSFDTLFRSVNAWGLAPELLRRLLRRPETGELVGEVVDGLRRLYGALEGHAFQKAWQFDLMHRQRFHVGGILGRLAWRAWPSAPLASDAVLAVAGEMPACALWGRRMQRDLLITRFPHLARLPLDRNSRNTMPLLPSMAQRVARRALERSGIERLLRGRAENRYYHRVFGIANEGWDLVTARCDACVKGLGEILDAAEYGRLLAGRASTCQSGADPIISASGVKSLLGFVLWYTRYVAGGR